MKSVAKWLVASLLAFGLVPLGGVAPANASGAPSISSLSPSSGSKFGGNVLQINGQNFSTTVSDPGQVLDVYLSTSASVTSLSFTVANSSRITATVPTLNGSISGSASVVISFSSVVVTQPYTLLRAQATQSSLAAAPAIGSFSTRVSGYSLSGNVAAAVLSTSRAVIAATVQPISDFQITVSVPVISESQRASDAVLRITFTDGSPASEIPIGMTGPTVSAIVTNSGTAAGGNSVTISGQGFFDAAGNPAVTKVMIGADLITSSNFVVVSDTTISATIPTRSGAAKTIGANRVAVFYADSVSSSQTVFYYFTPVRDVSKDVASLVMLRELASRSNKKPVFRTSAQPFLVTGVDSLTNQAYEYETNYSYPTSDACVGGPCLAYAREGYQPGYTKHLVNGSLVTRGTPSLGTATITSYLRGQNVPSPASVQNLPNDTVALVSNGSCGDSDNGFDSGDGQGVVQAFCTVFGPEIYSEAFYGKAGQSLGFSWLAIGNTDDYSVYGYLVAVQNENSIPSTDVASHTLVAHGVGSRAPGRQPSTWSSATADIPADGLYRFRFTNGSYDGTGGKAIGSTFLISSIYEAGLTNRINFDRIGDQTGNSVTVPVTALSGGQVTVVSRNTNSCTVSTSYAAPTTSVTITKVANGTCALVASRGLDGEYAPAADKLVAFDFRSSAIAPTAPVITQVNSGNQSLTVLFQAPSRDGGTPITSYEYSTDGGATWASASPASTATNITITSLSSNVSTALTNGVTYSIQVRAVSGVPTGLASNTAQGVPNAPSAPNISYNNASVVRTIGVVTQILAPTNTGGSVTTWAISSGSLPAGLTLNSSTGIISGNPSALGTSTVGITGTNSTSTSNVATLTITIVAVAANRPDITWSPGVVAVYTAYVGTAFTADTPSNSNTADSAVFTIQPGLPSGLTINSVTGVVSGTATVTSASVSYIITATNGAGNSTISFILTVLPAQSGSGGSGESGGSGGSAGAPSYNGPEITSITPQVVSTAGGETIVVVGRRLGTGMDVTIGGITVSLRNASSTGFSFVMPSLREATYDMIYRYDGGARLTYINAIRVAAPVVVNPDTGSSSPTVSPQPEPKPWSALGVASMFNPGSAVVTPRVRAQVVGMVNRFGSIATRIECTGFTMGPNVLARDAKLSRDRAAAVCNLIKQLRPRLEVVRAVGRQETRLGGEIRRVEVLFTR